MDSSRLRVPSQSAKKTETQAEFNEGDRVLARWTDSRKFPGTVNRVLENSNANDSTELLSDPLPNEFLISIFSMFPYIFQINSKSFLTTVV